MGSHVLRAKDRHGIAQHADARPGGLQNQSMPRTTEGKTSGPSTHSMTLHTRFSDAIEGITHSLCTLEFDVHRPLYDWLVDALISSHPDLISTSRRV